MCILDVTLYKFKTDPVIPRGHSDVTVAGDSNLKHNFPIAHQQKVRHRLLDVDERTGLPIHLSYQISDKQLF